VTDVPASAPEPYYTEDGITIYLGWLSNG